MGKSMTKQQWLDAEVSFEAWRASAPESITAATVEMRFLTSYAWDARGSGFAHEIIDNVNFKERIQRAHEIYDEVVKRYKQQNKAIECPGFYTGMLTVARVSPDWTIERVDRELLQPALALNPRYMDACLIFKVMIEPQWHGARDADYDFYKSLPNRIPREIGEEMYARIIIHQKTHAFNTYRPDLVDWELLKRGNLHAVKKFPNSVYLVSSFLNFAHRYGEQDELLAIYKKEVPKLMEKFFSTTAHGLAYKHHSEKKSSLSEAFYFKPHNHLGIDAIRTISTHPKDGIYSISCTQRGLKFFQLDSNEPIFEQLNEGEITGAVVFSRDGKFFFTASNRYFGLGRAHHPIRVYSYEDKKLTMLRQYDVPKDDMLYIEHCEFTPDSKGLVLAYSREKYQKRGQEKAGLYHWEWQKDDSKPQRFHTIPSGSYGHRIQMDDRANALYVGGENLLRFDLNDLASAPKPQIHDPTFKGGTVYNFAFLPDQKHAILLAAEKRKYGFILLDLKTGKALQRLPVTPQIGHPVFIELIADSGGQSGLLVAAEWTSGCMMTWRYTLKEGILKMQFEATLATNGQTVRSLATTIGPDGNRYMITGTKNGMVGVYRVKK